jgi:signal transduction histidine kinase
MAQSSAERVGADEALALIEDANERRIDIGIVFRAAPEALGTVPTAWVAEVEGERVLSTRIPVHVGKPGYLVLRESLVDEDAYVYETKHRILTMTLVITLSSAAIIFGLGAWIVGRPIRKLVDKARRIGRGELGEPLLLAQRDEIGELAQEMNAMCENLAIAQAAARNAAEQRLRAVDQLRHAERLITVGELAAGVAHEIGTPLNVVLARGKRVADAESEGAAARRDGEIICQQVERITKIIQSLLDFARRRRPQAAKVDLVALCTSVTDLLATFATKRGVTLELPLSTSLPATLDPGQIQQVLTNVIMNAIQAEAPGGVVRLSVEAVDALPGELGRDDGPFYRVRVEDTGPGMPPEVRRRAFEPFFTTKEPGQGTGLGLSVAHGIVEEHGGAVWIESEPGRGTRVDVFLPVDRAAS